MPPDPLTIWCNAPFPEPVHARLTAGIGGHRFVDATSDPDLGQADIAFGQPDAERAAASSRLRWVHLSSAGYTAYDRPDIRLAFTQRGARLTVSSGVFDEPCAQHALAFLLAHARALPQSLRHQHTDRAWTTAATRSVSRLLGPGQTVLIVGFGAIGRRISQLLAPFGMTIIGFRRNPPAQTEAVPVQAIAELDAWLPKADHIINVLPANAQSTGFFDKRRLGLMKPDATFINIGRGTTVDQDALVHALGSGALAAAYLDVTNPEPLPVDHPLWALPNCTITPHSAGGHHNEFDRLVSHFLANLARWDTGAQLVDQVI